MIAAAATADGVFRVDVEAEEVLGLDAGATLAPHAVEGLALPLLVAADAAGSRLVAVLDRHPPLAVSHDAGVTWREAGGGLPRGRDVAIRADDPDTILYAARNRLYVSRDGGRFWRALVVELPELRAVAWEEAG